MSRGRSSRLGGRRGGLFSRLVRIDQVAQFLAGLEVRNALGGNIYFGSGLGIAPDARLPLADAKAAKSANLDLVARFECADHGIENGVDNYFAITPCQVSKLRHFLNQFCLCHSRLRSSL